MDFAALMSKEISKAKAPAAAAPEQNKKYLKRAEVEAQRQADYLTEQRRIEDERRSKESQKRKREEEELEAKAEREEKRRRLAEESRIKREKEEKEADRAKRKKLGLPELEEKVEEEVLEDDVPDEELQQKLRDIEEPAKLFGESHKQRLRRWKKASTVMTKGPIPTSLVLVPEEEMMVDKVPEKGDVEGRKYLYRQLASYLTMVLTEWQNALAREEKRDTFASKAAVNAMVQSKENMTPLFRKFEKGDLDESILEPVVEIVKAAQERRYVDANDGYLRLSIGKAAWPIGVTMVGIHERSAREKIGEENKGHVMGDEVTRKFLQSIKRCLSFAQVRWPPTDVRQLMG